MKRATLFSLAVFASPAMAGTIAFEPPLQIVDPSVSTLASFDLRISEATANTYIAFTAVLGSDDLLLTDWQWGPACPGGSCPGPTSPGFYPSDFKIGFFVAPSPVPVGELLGTLTVDAAGLAPGDYTVVIDPNRDTGFSALTTTTSEEPLSGIGTVRVVPEPATLLLLAVGGVVLYVRRRRVSALNV